MSISGFSSCRIPDSQQPTSPIVFPSVFEITVRHRLVRVKLPVCERWYVTKLCVCVSVCEVIVC